MKKSNLTAPGQKPNIKFIGKDALGEPLEKIINGNSVYLLPSPDEQRRGFFHPNAKEICETYGNRYKLILPKSRK